MKYEVSIETIIYVDIEADSEVMASDEAYEKITNLLEKAGLYYAVEDVYATESE